MNAPSTHKTSNQQQIVYQNPTPVVVAVVPVFALNPASGVKELGLLALERGIEPKRGALALPGGYLEYEDWRVGLLRELKEETSVAGLNAQSVTEQAVRSIDNGKKLIIFGLVPAIDEKELQHFTPREECPRLKVLFAPEELAFPTHTEVAKNFFEMRKNNVASGLHQLQTPPIFTVR
jgi:8-oxo-dGTP diphosphatase